MLIMFVTGPVRGEPETVISRGFNPQTRQNIVSGLLAFMLSD